MYIPNNNKLIGIDLGGTKIQAALIKGDNILKTIYRLIPANTKNKNDIINIVSELISDLIEKDVAGIGIGVPSLVDREKGIIYNVQNIPSWENIPLADILQKRFEIPVLLDNDANCFALGEYRFGAGQACENFVGLTLGTGMGAGIITEGHLFKDANCGSGEFGSIPYLDSIYEDYCSGKFFKRFYGQNGEELYKKAEKNNEQAIKAFQEFGKHLGNAVKTILFAVDPNKIIIGGSVSYSKKFFEKTLYESLKTFPYPKSIEKLEIIFTKTPNIAIFGAASLYYDRIKVKQ